MSHRAEPATLLEALTACLHAERAKFNSSAEVAPVALLWPDEDGQWLPLTPALRAAGVPLLTLGDFDLETQTGPAIWIRTRLNDYITEGETPVVYLPGHSNASIADEEHSPEATRPLLFIRYRGRVFNAPNSKDWTIAAFLQNEQQGLGLTVDKSHDTRTALNSALRELASRPLAELRAQSGGIDAAYLNQLLMPDPVRQLLRWIEHPKSERDELEEAGGWDAFCQQMRASHQFDPATNGATDAAALLGGSTSSAWNDVWTRFADSPERWPGVIAALRIARPAVESQASLFDDGTPRWRWPQENEEAELDLRQALTRLATRSEADARRSIRDLEAQHASRRSSVWAELGQTPLANALEQIAVVATKTGESMPVANLDAMMASWSDVGWRIDDAALRALAAVESAEDREAVVAALTPIYQIWLHRHAEHFQQHFQNRPAASKPQSRVVPPGTCVLFADGLRFDLGMRLHDSLKAAGFESAIESSLGPLPGITSSAKPAQTPVASAFVPGSDFNVLDKPNGTNVNISVLTKAIEGQGWTVLPKEQVGMPDGESCAWTEYGNFDSYGHNAPDDLPRQSEAEIQALYRRIESLLKVGWKQVVVVTDHGWLLTPKPMEKALLAEYLTEVRKGRCARLKPNAQSTVPTIPWAWDASVAIAIAPGLTCFEAGKRYEHGGLSLQECVIPTLTVRSQAPAAASASITTVGWTNLRCTVECAGDLSGVQIDVRRKASDPASSMLDAPETDISESTRFLVSDEYEGEAAFVVLLDGSGKLLMQSMTTVGGA